jgi:hypothetical protein
MNLNNILFCERSVINKPKYISLRKEQRFWEVHILKLFLKGTRFSLTKYLYTYLSDEIYHEDQLLWRKAVIVLCWY